MCSKEDAPLWQNKNNLPNISGVSLREATLGALRSTITAMPPRFEILEHPADVGFRAYGATLTELFQNAALALVSIAGDLERIEERERREIEATGSNTESLLYEWLAEIVAVADADRLVLRRVEVTSLGADRVSGVAYGERYDRTRHRAGTAIKAVTYHKFLVELSPTGWVAEVFLDV